VRLRHGDAGDDGAARGVDEGDAVGAVDADQDRPAVGQQRDAVRLGPTSTVWATVSVAVSMMLTLLEPSPVT